MHFERVRLGDALELLMDYRGRTPKKLGGEWAATGVRVISAINIKNGQVDSNNLRYISADLYDRWMPEKLHAGDVLLTSEAPLGEVAYITEAVQACLGQRLFALRARPNVLDGRYLYYLLRYGPVRSQLLGRATGTTVSGIRQSELVQIELHLPPLAKQKEISGILGALDDKINLNLQIAERAELLLRTMFLNAFPTSNGGRNIELGSLIALERKQVQPGTLDHDTPYIGLEHMPRGSIALNHWGNADQVASAKLKFEKGDVLFGKLRPYFKKVGLAPVDGICSSDILVIRSIRPVLRAFVLMVLSSPEFIDYTEAVSAGTRMPRVSWADVAKYQLQEPSDEAAEAFEHDARPILDLITSQIHESRSLVELRELMIPGLMQITERKSVGVES